MTGVFGLVIVAVLLAATSAHGQCPPTSETCSNGVCESCPLVWRPDTSFCEPDYSRCTRAPDPTAAPVDDTSTLPAASDFPDPPTGPSITTDPIGVCSSDPSCTITRVQRQGSRVLDCQRNASLPECATVGLDEDPNYNPAPPPVTPVPASNPPPQEGGDPLVLATGALRFTATDLSYSGPVRHLEFVRRYDSRSDVRGTMGSNWSHGFEDYLVVVGPADLSAPALCRQTENACVRHRDGSGAETLFVRLADQSFYVSPTRSDATLHPTSSGWILQEPDGHQLLFDEQGYLSRDRDRFGNGFTISQEETPLYRMYQRWCLGNGPAEFPNDDPRVCAALAYAFEDAPARSWATWKVPDGASVPLVTEKCEYQFRGDPSDGRNCEEVGWWDIPGRLILPGVYVSQCGDNPPAFEPYTDPSPTP